MKYKSIKDKTYFEERSLFKSNKLNLFNVSFKDGESPLKESKNINLENCNFYYKYPLWYGKNFNLLNCHFYPISRSGIWYTKNITIKDSLIEAPKEFRRSKNIYLENVIFLDASETLWECENVKLSKITAKGDYLLMNSKNIEIDNLNLDGNYLLDGSKNIVVKNSILNSKDSFWNCENIVVKNSTIIGEYIGWNSKNITFINCHIESKQGFCYMKNLKMINCTLKNTNLAFEYSTIDCEINSNIDSVKNPISGKLICNNIDELILDDNSKCDFKNLKIIQKEKN